MKFLVLDEADYNVELFDSLESAQAYVERQRSYFEEGRELYPQFYEHGEEFDSSLYPIYQRV